MVPKHVFWVVIDRSSFYPKLPELTRSQCCFAWSGGRGVFRSRDKVGGHTNRSAIIENPLPDANSRPHLLWNQSYCRSNVCIARIGNFAFFYKKNNGKYQKFCSHSQNDENDAKIRLLSYEPRTSVKRRDLCR